jgi:hypothetical protein
VRRVDCFFDSLCALVPAGEFAREFVAVPFELLDPGQLNGRDEVVPVIADVDPLIACEICETQFGGFGATPPLIPPCDKRAVVAFECVGCLTAQR